MKTYQRNLTPVILALFLLGCAGGNTSSSIIANSQKTLAQAKVTMTTYVRLERTYETQLRAISPEFHAYAETIRANGQQWLRDGAAAIDSYIANKDKTALDQGMAAVTTALSLSKHYIDLANQKGVK
jgi:hypothetical protein